MTVNLALIEVKVANFGFIVTAIFALVKVK